jgi:hypothetical protein
MRIEKEIKSKLESDYFFIVGSLDDVDTGYFINKIEEAIKLPNNLNYKTNVMGKATPWFYFSKDKLFIQLVNQIIDYLEFKKIPTVPYCLNEVWGIKEGFADYTQLHNHLSNYLSGVIYLNDHPQKLYFPQINEEIIPATGKFAIFSSFLDHYTRRNEGDNNKYGLAFNFKYKGIYAGLGL